MKTITLFIYLFVCLFIAKTFYLRSPFVWDTVHHHWVSGSSHPVTVLILQLNGSNCSINAPNDTVNGPVHPANGSNPCVNGHSHSVNGPTPPLKGLSHPVNGPNHPVNGPSPPLKGLSHPVNGPNPQVSGPIPPLYGPNHCVLYRP